MAARRKEVAARMEELAREIRRHDELYYNEGIPEIADSVYDALVRELRELEQAHPDLAADDSPTRRVGAAPRPRGFAQLGHVVPMLSLESLTSDDEVREFDERVRKALGLEPGAAPVMYVMEPKYDGVSASLLYEAGRLTHGLTRGDGRVGEDITRNLLRVRNVRDTLGGRKADWPDRIEIRGEVILSKQRFEAIRVAQEAAAVSPFRNARNAVAGALKRIDPDGLEDLEMEFWFWGVGELRGLAGIDDYDGLCARIRRYGFPISPQSELVEGVSEAIAYHDRLEAARDELPYEMDGVVAKVNDFAAQHRLGRTGRAPRWAWAHKFASRRAWTRVLEVRVQVGRTGTITPVAVLEPVELAGVTVQRATLHNFDLLAERDIRPGDRVEIERAGDVIPAVVQVDREARGDESVPFEVPSECPACAEPVRKEGAFLYCTNIDCPAQIRERIVHLASRRALDIDRLGEKYADQLLESGLIERVEDVFTLPDRRDEILALERWGPQSYETLARESARAKRPELARFLFALGIRQVGERVSSDLAEAMGTLESVTRADAEQLVEIDGIGPKVADEIVGFFARPSTRAFLAALSEAGVDVQPVHAVQGDAPLAGRVFCFTGGLSALSRDHARQRVEALGAASASGISKRVTDVVAGRGAGSKLEKAGKLGLKVLTEEEFLQLLDRLENP